MSRFMHIVLLAAYCALVAATSTETETKNVLHTRDRVSELNELNQKHHSKNRRNQVSRIANVSLSKDAMRQLEPQVMLFPVNVDVSSAALKSEKELPNNVIVSSSFDTQMLGAIIQPPRPGATKPPTTTRNPRDGTPEPTTTPLAVRDVPPAPQAAVLQHVIFNGGQVDRTILEGDWIRQKQESEEKKRKIRRKHRREEQDDEDQSENSEDEEESREHRWRKGKHHRGSRDKEETVELELENTEKHGNVIRAQRRRERTESQKREEEIATTVAGTTITEA